MVKVNATLTRVSNATDSQQACKGDTNDKKKGLVIDSKVQKAKWGLQGKNKSGRPHKSRKAKFSSSIAVKKPRTFEQRMKDKQVLNDIKAREKELIDDRVDIKRQERQRLKEKAAKTAENAIKSSTFQSISSEKVKKLGKKQLRMIHKVDFDQIRDSRIGVGLRTAFGTMKERGSYGKRR